jgi:hypothetical protein
MSDPSRIEDTYSLPRWVRSAAEARLAAVAAAEAKLAAARADVTELLRHVRAICGDEDARAWCLGIGIGKATLRKFWNKSGTTKRERTV